MSNVGQIALDVVGLVASIYTANPIWLTLAMGAGSVLFPTQLPAGPRLTDHRTTTASIGDPVALVFGTSTVAGTVIWLAPSVESKSGGKGGPQQTTYNYTQSIAIGLCEAVIDGGQAIGGLSRIWENGEIVYDIRPQLQANTYTGQVAETDTDYANRLAASQVYAATFTLYLGTEDQQPDPTIEANEGYGNVPAYRGLAYIVYPNRALQTAQGWRHPNFQFEVYQSGTGGCTTATQYSNDVLYPWNVSSADPTNSNNTNTFSIISYDTSAPDYVNPGNGNEWTTLSAALGFTDLHLTFSMDTAIGYQCNSVGGGGPGNYRGGNTGGAPIITHGDGDADYVYVHYSFVTPASGHFYNTFPAETDPVLFAEGTIYNVHGLMYKTLGTSDGTSEPTVSIPWLNAAGGGSYQPSVGAPYIYFNWAAITSDVIIGVRRTPSKPLDPCDGLPAAPISGYCVQPDGKFVQSAEWTKDTTHNYLVLATYVSSNDEGTASLYPQNPCLLTSDANAYNEVFWTNAYNEAVANGLMPAGYTYTGGSGSHHYPVAQNYAWTLDKTVCTGAGSEASVGSIIAAVCARAGLDSVDVDDLIDVYVGGYTIANLTSGASIISPLRSVAFFDAVESGDTLRFQARGKDPVATLTTDDIGAYDGGKGDVPPSVQTTRTLDIDLARRIRLHYASTSRDYQDAEQDSPFRLTTTAVNDQDVSLPLSLGDTQALQSAEIIWADMWAGRTAHTVAVDQSWAALEPGDCIQIPVDNVLYRSRIVSYKVASGVLMTLSLVRDDGDSYFSTAIAEPPRYTAPTLTFLAQTQIVFLDLPSLQDADADAGFYIAAARNPGTGNSWPGATIYQSLDGGETFNTLTTITTEATIGVIAYAVPESNWHTWDDVTSIYVNVASSAFTFESRTDAAVLSGANAAAMGSDGRWEIVQFANAELISTSTAGVYQWKLTRLLRGRRGTEYNIGTSIAGDTFVLVSTGDLARITQSTTAIGAARIYKAVTSEAPYSTAAASTFTGHGEALIPFSPVEIKAIRQSDGDILISWIRRDRLGRTLMSGVDIPMSEATELFSIDILTAGSPATVERTLTSSTESVVYQRASQVSDFGSTELTEISVRIYQISAVVGRGTAGEALLELT